MITEFNWGQAVTESPIFLILLGCSVITLGITLERAKLGVAVEAGIARPAVDAAKIGQRGRQHGHGQQDRKKTEDQPASQPVGDLADHLMASPAEKIGR